MERTKQGLKTSLIGMVCNLILASAKLAIGLLSGSISIVSDSINNFGDAVSTGAMAFSFKLSGKKADKSHPFGHGRIEYVVAFIIAVLIIIAGGEFLISSIERIVSPTAVSFSWLAFSIILASIFIKLGMAVFYHFSNKKLSSMVFKAAKLDSLQDAIITSVTLIAFTLSKFTAFPVDGVAGTAISVLILINGIKIVRETIDTIMGAEKDTGLAAKITATVTGEPQVLGAHDLLLHDYGPQISIASIHAELPCTLSLTEAHRIVDCIEKKVMAECGVDLVVHIDPTDTESTLISALRKELRIMLEDISPLLSYHDFDLDEEKKQIAFDIVIPFSSGLTEEAVTEGLEGKTLHAYSLAYRFDYQ